MFEHFEQIPLSLRINLSNKESLAKKLKLNQEVRVSNIFLVHPSLLRVIKRKFASQATFVLAKVFVSFPPEI
jgi:hypothetical protein